MLMPIRKWRDIKGYEGLYQVSNLGEVKSLNYIGTGKTKLLKLGTNKKGYKLVHLYKNGKRKSFKVHRLVAEAFIPNPNNLPQVNHKDEDKSNNIWTNLEWCTAEYNNNYGTRIGRISKKSKGRKLSEETRKRISELKRGNKNRRIKIKCVTTGEIFSSVTEASKYYKVAQPSISQCLRGKRKSAGKDKITGEPLKWEYID